MLHSSAATHDIWDGTPVTAASQHAAGPTLPRSLLTVGVPIAGVLLIAFFMIKDFRYDLIGDRIASELEQSAGIRMSIGSLEPTLQLAGPALEGRDIRATLADGTALEIERALVRPAWSLSWLAGDPLLHVELDSQIGSAAGTTGWGSARSWNGSLWNVDLQSPLFRDLSARARLEGRLEAEVDLIRGESGLEGTIDLEILDAALNSPGLPLPLPFEALRGKLALGGSDPISIESLEFEGPVVAGSGSGTIGKAPSLALAPLSLDLQLTVQPALSGAARSAGLRVDRNGEAKARVSGTIADPTIR